jgi:hypothetical protein
MKNATGWSVIANGQLVDGKRGRPIGDAAVVVHDGKIAYAGPAGKAPIVPGDAQRIDARGGTIMPGLVEAVNQTLLYGRMPAAMKTTFANFMCSVLLNSTRQNVHVLPEEIIRVVLRFDRSQAWQVRAIHNRRSVEHIVFEVVQVTRRRQIRRE